MKKGWYTRGLIVVAAGLSLRAGTIRVDNALRKIYEAVRKNGMVAVLIDQNAGSQGTPVPFLGRETSTVRSVAGLVHKTGCAVLPIFAILREDNTYEVSMFAAPQPDFSGKSDEECVKAYQLQHNGIVSGWIRQHPEHWFGWFHKKFRESIKY